MSKMSKNQKKSTKIPKSSDELPLIPPKMIFGIDKIDVSKNFLELKVPNAITEFKETNHNEVDLKPFDYNKFAEYMNNIEGKSFIDQPRVVINNEGNYTSVLNGDNISTINNDYRKIPSKIDGIYAELTQYQRTSIAAMIELEEKKSNPV